MFEITEHKEQSVFGRWQRAVDVDVEAVLLAGFAGNGLLLHVLPEGLFERFDNHREFLTREARQIEQLGLASHNILIAQHRRALLILMSRARYHKSR